MTLPQQPYNPNVPATIDENLQISGPSINQNWNSIANTYAFNHSALGSASDVGFHTQITPSNLTTLPTVLPSNCNIFAQLVGLIPQLFLQFPTSVGAPGPIQITSYPVPVTYLIPTAGACSVTEITLIICGITIKIGTITLYIGGSGGNLGPLITLTFGGTATPNPFPTTLVSLGLSPSKVGFTGTVPLSYLTSSANLSTFQYQSNVGYDCSYIAMGY